MGLSFTASTHEYLDTATGEVLPSVTQMLQIAGLVNSDWFTAESAARGTAVHQLCADWDHDAIQDLGALKSPHKAYLLAHVDAMRKIKPEILCIEQALMHERWRFAGTPDRVVKIYGRLSVLELKSGQAHSSHLVQTALQAMLVSAKTGVPAESIGRFGLYLKGTGRFTFEAFTRRRDFDCAMTVIRKCCS